MSPAQKNPASAETNVMMAQDAAEMDPFVEKLVMVSGIIGLLLIVIGVFVLAALDRLGVGIIVLSVPLAVLCMGAVRPRFALKIAPGLRGLIGAGAKAVRPFSKSSRVTDEGPPSYLDERRKR